MTYYITIPFPTMYLCEATMSGLVSIKTIYCNFYRVANVMRIDVSNITLILCIDKLVQSLKSLTTTFLVEFSLFVNCSLDKISEVC